MKIDGLIRRPLKTVRLDPDFFERPTGVKIGFLPPVAEAKLKEVHLIGVQFVQKGNDFVPERDAEKQTEAALLTRNIKLEYGVKEHDITVDGKPADWGPELWEALDAEDPRILRYIIKEIDEFSTFKGGGSTENPT